MIRLRKYIQLTRCYGVLFIAVFYTITANASTLANDDFIIILDQSKSMIEQVPGVEGKYFEEEPLKAEKARGAIEAIEFIVDTMLRNGDYFSLITFGEEAKLFLSQQVGYQHERDLIKREIRTLPFMDKKTDILAGLKEASDLLAALKTPQRRKLLVMITDGKNDPREDSPYFTPEAQERVFKELEDTIRENKWNVVLVGIGELTKDHITDIAQKLSLPVGKAITVEGTADIGEQIESTAETGPIASESVELGITEAVEDLRKAVVEMEIKTLKLTLKPKLFGGYETGQETLSLTSSFEEEVEIQLDNQTPIVLTGSSDLQVNIVPLHLSLAPQQPGVFTLHFSFTGKRPEEGRVSGNFIFQLSETSTPFYPYDGKYDVILPSWLEVYGVYAMLAIVLTLFLLLLIIWLIRRIMVPEIRISVTANDMPLGSPLTLRRKESFTIANGDFSNRAVSAKGLDCKTAATVKYLGRRKFEVRAVEARIMDDGKERQQIQLGMEELFDLKDGTGKRLSAIMITTPAKGGEDIFGGGRHDSEPF